MQKYKKIGSLGRIDFDKGVYACIGSAQNNLEKRVQKHKAKKKNRVAH